MPRRPHCLLVMLCVLAELLCQTGGASARPPEARIAALRRGINITGWFRHPVSADPAALRSYLGDGAIADLRQAGFTFVRLAVDPALLEAPAIRDVLVGAVRRLNRVGLAVVISIHPNAWHLETSPADRDRLHAAWQRLAPALRRLDPARVIPELLNEPVFPGDPAGWHRLQQALLAQLRADLPASTIVLTGHDWSSIAGLQALTPEADSDVVYGFHFYDPPELTSLAAYRAGLDRAALARLPFPADDPPACDAVARPVSDPATRDLMRYYCALHWDHARIRARIDAAADWARRHNVVLLAGEFGASIDLNAAARLAWLRTVRDRFEANGIGWALWGYDDRMGLGIQRPPGNAPLLPAETLQALGLSSGAALCRRHGFP